MRAALKPLTSSSRTIRLSLRSRIARTVSNDVESISSSSVPAAGKVNVYRSDRPRLVRQLAVGEGAVQLIAQVERSGRAGLRIAGLERVLETRNCRRRQVAETCRR